MQVRHDPGLPDLKIDMKSDNSAIRGEVFQRGFSLSDSFKVHFKCW